MAADAMDINMQVILKDPKWSQRVVYMRGSVLRDTDLKRCRIAQAEACFILAPRYLENRTIAVSLEWFWYCLLRLGIFMSPK
ncbi:hypothetical protein DPMN_073654 [Dreissena polymorpha]|uniref:RCK N-terminal domain-containing protein n=1 Tax=Dreissena polymorpha TaxID=45954 RepID=A0A9D4HBD9_DREPO|nr:hypothetical protein DPMN_073647 [Dreissena polymorpha]KAH3713853.1 hypothetical protein DPMN_073654 [Dreissena polymorpha]